MTNDVHSMAGAFALDAIPAQEQGFFERHLQVCEVCTAEVDEFRETAAALADTTALVPPHRLGERLQSMVDVTRQLPPVQPPATQRRRDGVLQRLRPVLAPVAASLALAVVILTSVVADQQDRLGELEAAQGQPAQQEIVPVLAATDARTAVLDVGKGRSARFLYSVDRNQAVLVTDGMEAPGPRKSYELWLFHDGEPRPAAVFNPDRKGRSIAVVDGAVAGAEVLAVTVEPAGGSPKPTGPIVASLDL